MSEQLKPCPHCGDLAWMHDGSVFPNGGRGYRVECEGACHAMTCWWHTEAEAIAAWNRRPAPDQSREEEADPMALPREIASGMRKFISMVRDDEGGVHGWNFETENAAQWIASQLAALRFRQPLAPADEPSADYPPGQCKHCGAPVPYHYDKCIEARPSSPQGEDAADDALLRGIDGALRAYNELRRDEPLKLTGRECIFADLLSQLRARLASAQSSAQGEEAREMREALAFYADPGTYRPQIKHASDTPQRGILPIMLDTGDKARAALERKEGE